MIKTKKYLLVVLASLILMFSFSLKNAHLNEELFMSSGVAVYSTIYSGKVEATNPHSAITPTTPVYLLAVGVAALVVNVANLVLSERKHRKAGDNHMEIYIDF